MAIRTHKDLDVWREAVSLAEDVYRISKRFPKEEMYGLTSQVRRAAVSIASNIAEDAARPTDKDFCHFLHIAAGSASVLSRRRAYHQSHPGESRQGASRSQWRALGKGRNAALVPRVGSLRASPGGRAAVLRSFELATASPALARLAAHPARAC